MCKIQTAAHNIAYLRTACTRSKHSYFCSLALFSLLLFFLCTLFRLEMLLLLVFARVELIREKCYEIYSYQYLKLKLFVSSS